MKRLLRRNETLVAITLVGLILVIGFNNPTFFTLGNVFTAMVNAFIQNEDGTSKLAGPSYFWFFTVMMLLTAVVFIFVARTYREKSYIQDEAPYESAP